MNRVDDWMQDGEDVSALVDGHLRNTALDQTLNLLQSSGRARVAWADYHLVREALQAGQVQVSTDDAEFVARLRQRLAAESPRVAPVVQLQMVRPAGQVHSANAARWKRVVGLASLAVAAVVAWQGLQRAPSDQDVAVAQLAPSHAQPAGNMLVLTSLEREPIFAATQPVMIRDARLDALLAANRQTEAKAAVPAPSAFVRNATFVERRP